MILGEKILMLRKKLGWSQEELADKMNVSRQSVSKWESSQSIPDIGKITELSSLFGVSTDYLLKDNIECEEEPESEEKNVRRINISEAREYLNAVKGFASQISIGVMLCILSPVTVITLAAFENYISEAVIGGVGVIAVLSFVAAAVAIFIIASLKFKRFEFIGKGEFESEYGVECLVQEDRSRCSGKLLAMLVVGVVLCIMSACPLIIVSLMTENTVAIVLMVSVLLVIVSAGVFMLTYSAITNSGYSRLLREGEYNRENIKINKAFDKFESVYWIVMTIVYLAWSFIGHAWKISWIIWPIAGLLLTAISAALKKSD